MLKLALLNSFPGLLEPMAVPVPPMSMLLFENQVLMRSVWKSFCAWLSRDLLENKWTDRRLVDHSGDLWLETWKRLGPSGPRGTLPGLVYCRQRSWVKEVIPLVSVTGVGIPTLFWRVLVSTLTWHVYEFM